MQTVAAPLVLFALLAGAPVAHAAEPDTMSDAIYVGARIDPGVALLAGWELDVYLDDDRALSLGPAASIALFGTGERPGMDQELSVAIDGLRFDAVLTERPSAWRPYVVVGGGVSYTRLRAQDDGTVSYEREDVWAAMATIGAGADFFTGGPWALCTVLHARIHLWASERLPLAWIELATGVRFGL